MNMPHPCRRSRGQQGFTVAELLATLVIATLILTIAVPKLTGSLRALNQRTATSQVAGDLALARGRAVREGRRASVIVLSANTYNVTISRGGTDTIVKRVTLEGARGAVALTALQGTAYPAAVTFNSRGLRTSANGGFRIIQNTRTDTLSVSFVGRVYRGGN